jgi:uncharacterized protein YerC
MNYEIKTISTAWDEAGYEKRTHIITIPNIENFADLRSAFRQVKEVIWDDIYVPREYSQYDCTGSYSTRKIERVHRSLSYGTLLVIVNEYGSYDI